MRSTLGFTLFNPAYELKGSVSHLHAINPSDYERANYLQVLDSYSGVSGVWQ
jgi:dihydroorotate dehydrogenase (fumarate)